MFQYYREDTEARCAVCVEALALLQYLFGQALKTIRHTEPTYEITFEGWSVLDACPKREAENREEDGEP